ncbi:MAG: sigma-70 family RNA polymerase sigma factor [Acidobacteria bacterium]|nr:sigma-70 family RNA polymerase sigma factor [Acidobacteriota bacterium]
MPSVLTQRDEAALIERIRGGEKELYYELIRPHERSVYLAAYAIVKNEADAEDVTQEAFLKAYRHLGGFRGESRFLTWVVRIVINEARMRLRKDHRHLYESLDDTAPEGETSIPLAERLADWREVPSEVLERSEVREEIARALDSLPASYREILVLRDVQQLSIAETAGVLGATQATVKIRLFRARLRLRDLLAPKLAGSLTSRPALGKGRKPW